MNKKYFDEILGASVRWFNGRANFATIVVEVKHDPKDFRYLKKNDVFFGISEGTGAVSFFMSNPWDKKGHSYDTLSLTMEDGSCIQVEGLYSTDNKTINNLGLPNTTQVLLSCSSEDMEYNSNMLNEVLRDVIRLYIPELSYYVAKDGTIFIPKNQPLNKEYDPLNAFMDEIKKPLK
jgi:hypothetical protein